MAYYIPPTLKLDLNNPEKFGNIAELLTEEERRKMATFLLELIGIDDRSMSEWRGKAEGYLKRLEHEQKDPQQNAEQAGSAEDAGSPSVGLTLSAVVQFAAQATDALLGEPDIAKASEDSPAAGPLATWVSSQLRTRDENWTADTDPLIIHMAVTGLAWRKRTFDEDDVAFHSYFLTCSEVIVNANIRKIERAPRITHEFQRYPYEIERSIRRGHWVDYTRRYDESDPQAPKNFYETDLWMDLDGDGMEEPWTVTLSRDDLPEVIKIKARWSKKTIIDDDEKLYFKPIWRYYPYKFLPSLDGSFFPNGFGWLLYSSEQTANDLLASILDTAKTEGENGGVLAGSSFGLPDKIEVKGNRVTTIPTERPLGDAFQAFPTKSVSAGAVAVLEKVITLGDRLAGTLNTLENAPASMTATLAKGIIDSGTKVQSAVHRRAVASLTMEIRAFVRMADAYDALPEEISVSQAGGVEVTADPALATEMHRSALAGVYMELMKDPLTNWKEVRLRLYRTLRLPNPEALLGEAPQPQATPFEKIQGAVAVEKARSERIKVNASVALQLAQALKAMVEAQSGAVDTRMALLQMAQLEHTVQQLMAESGGAGTGFDGLAGGPGNGGPAAALPAPAGPGSGPVPDGPAGGPGAAGAGGSISGTGDVAPAAGG